MRQQLLCYGLIVITTFAASQVMAEEYMKRGATVEDYQQALNRTLDRHRGIRRASEPTLPPAPAAPPTPAIRAAAPPPTPAPPPPRAATPAAPRAVAAPRPVAPPIATDVPPPREEDSGGISIYFGFDTAHLTADAAEALSNLGQALQSEDFREVTWLIEGHTDASGSADYNQRLSERRAQSVQRYLVENFGIPQQRLIAIGKGKSEPYLRDQPYASVNRRVRIRPISG